MTRAARLDAYHFYEDDWESYDALCAAFEWAVPDRFNMAAYCCDRWAEGGNGDAVALFAESDDGWTETYTFGEMQGLTNRLANYLRAQGVERGDRVGVNAPQRPETVFAHLAAWKLGAVSVPLSTLFGPDAVGYRLGDCDAVAAVVDASNLDNYREAREGLSGLSTTLIVGDATPEEGEAEAEFWAAIEDHSPDFEPVDTAAEDDAIFIYTSGTTGDPKGVRHAQRMLLGHLPLFLTTFGNMRMEEDDVFWTPAEWAWIASLFDSARSRGRAGRPDHRRCERRR